MPDRHPPTIWVREDVLKVTPTESRDTSLQQAPAEIDKPNQARSGALIGYS